MSDGSNSDIERELFHYCQSDLLSEEGVRQIIERHGFITNHHHVSNYQFFSWACVNERVTEGIIQCLLEYFPDAAKDIDDKGWTPLHFACGNPNVTLNIIKLIIHAAPASVPSEDNRGMMPLHDLCSNGRVSEGMIQCLLEHFSDAASAIDDLGHMPLHVACKNPNVTLNIIKLLIDAAPASVGSEDNGGSMPLHMICNNKKVDEATALKILKLFIERCPEAIRHANDRGRLPIHKASRGRSPEFCRVLIEAYPGSERITSDMDILPLHHACTKGSLVTVEYLYGIFPEAINHPTRSNLCPIHCAILGTKYRANPAASVEIVQFLLDCDPDQKLKQIEGRSLLHFACELVRDSNIQAGINVMKILFDAHPEAIEDNRIGSNIHLFHQRVQSFVNSELVYARQAKDLRLMMTPDEHGQLPLHKAIQSNVRLGSIKLLVKGNPYAVRSIDDSYALPLHVACEHHDSTSVVEYILGLAHITRDATDRDGNSALHYACRGAKYDTIALLLEKYGASSISKRNANGKLPIDMLWESNKVGDRESVEYMESIFQLLKACPETVMNFDTGAIQNQSGNGKKRTISQLGAELAAIDEAAHGDRAEDGESRSSKRRRKWWWWW